MALALMFAGQEGPLVTLANCMRSMHAEAVANVIREIEKRKQSSDPVPSDESSQWGVVRKAWEQIELACAAEDGVLARASAQAILEATEEAPELPKALDLPPELEEIRVQFRTVNAAENAAFNGKVAGAGAMLRDAVRARDTAGANAARELIAQARTELLCAALVRIEGIEDVAAPLSAAMIDALRNADLFPHLVAAARHFQSLDKKKASRFGLAPDQASATTTAASAPSSSEKSADATAARWGSMVDPHTSPAPSSRPTPAPSDTSLRTEM